jgi:hypothetical protein
MKMDRASVQASLHQLQDDVRPIGDLGAALARVADATQHLFEADGAGIMVIDDEQALAYVQTPDEERHDSSRHSGILGQGPCVRLPRPGPPRPDRRSSRPTPAGPSWAIVSRALGCERCWGPISIAGGPVGSLNVYRSEPASWDDSEVDAIRAFAAIVEDLVGSALLARSNEQLAQQLQQALQSRTVIERAVGFLMATDGVDAVTAFDGLRRSAREQRRKVVDLAAEVVGTTPPSS